jgi:hypothetical protein
MKTVYFTAVTGGFFAFRHQRFFLGLYRSIAFHWAQVGGQIGGGLPGHTIQRLGHIDTRTGRCGELSPECLGQTATFQKVIIDRTVVLNTAVGAVMIGDNQAFW